MSKIVSMLKAFKREKKGSGSFDEAVPGSRKSRNVLEAESFVFLPGNAGGEVGGKEMYWGEIINDDSFPASQRRDARRRTHIGLNSSDNGVQEVNLFIRTRSDAADEDKCLLNGKVYNRRYSGTLVNAKKNVDDDGPVIRDYAFLLTNNNTSSDKSSRDRYVYDRLIRTPLQPANSGQSQPRRLAIVTDSRSSNVGDKERCSLRKADLTELSRVPEDGPHLQVPSRVTGKLSGRPVSLQMNRHNYSDLEWVGTLERSEYALPPDAVSWELNLEGRPLPLDGCGCG